MQDTKSEREPEWWTVQYTVVWQEAEPALRDDFERRATDRYRAQMKNQGPDDMLVQSDSTTPRNVDVAHANRVADDDWELGVEWDQVRSAYRYGVGARAHHANQPRWTEELEESLRADWGKTYEPSAWQKLKRAVRRGFEFKGKSRD